MMVLVFRWNGFEEDEEEAEQKRIVDDHKQKMLLSVKDDVEIAASEERIKWVASHHVVFTNTRKDNEKYFVTLKVASTI